jgi:hypothetical protein
MQSGAPSIGHPSGVFRAQIGRVTIDRPTLTGFDPSTASGANRAWKVGKDKAGLNPSLSLREESAQTLVALKKKTTPRTFRINFAA